MNQEPTHPGKVFYEEYLQPKGITQSMAAKSMRLDRTAVNRLCNGERAMTAFMAVAISRYTATSPQFWLRMQDELDLYHAYKLYYALNPQLLKG